MNEKKYHHGDLKRDLIVNGVKLLAREGYEGFSMRKLAVLCNVSHAAPYKHFKSKEEIILAISQGISDEFSGALTDAISRFPDDCRLQVIEMGKQYIRFMVENPDYFRFVFMTAHGRPIVFSQKEILFGESPPLAIARKCAEAYFHPLHENGEGWFKDFMMFWSMLHGLTLMLVSHTVRYEGEYLELAQALIEEFINNEGARA